MNEFGFSRPVLQAAADSERGAGDSLATWRWATSTCLTSLTASPTRPPHAFSALSMLWASNLGFGLLLSTPWSQPWKPTLAHNPSSRLLLRQQFAYLYRRFIRLLFHRGRFGHPQTLLTLRLTLRKVQAERALGDRGDQVFLKSHAARCVRRPVGKRLRGFRSKLLLAEQSSQVGYAPRGRGGGTRISVHPGAPLHGVAIAGVRQPPAFKPRGYSPYGYGHRTPPTSGQLGKKGFSHRTPPSTRLLNKLSFCNTIRTLPMWGSVMSWTLLRRPSAAMHGKARLSLSNLLADAVKLLCSTHLKDGARHGVGRFAFGKFRDSRHFAGRWLNCPLAL
mmetsp:Transcript_28616/g.84718  ORF Transcript_28616/g.84718 Transcript_28616/m.84718 type:complete len:334 (-) Transcript_28616:623-1624(-)